MNRKQRIAIIFLVLAIAVLALSLLVRASVSRLSDADEMPVNETVSSEAMVSLQVLPPQDIEDKGESDPNGKG